MSPHYDVFLSHATADKPEVEYLARKLQKAGIAPFLDKWHLIPGRIWQKELADGLRNSDACAIFVGSEGFGPWHTQEMLLALDRGARDPEFPVIPVLLPGFKKPSEIPDFLAQRTWVEFSRLEDDGAFHRLVCGIRGEVPKPGGESAKLPRPYRSMAQAPEEFIPRREYDEVLEALCPGEGAIQSGMSVGITTALRGAGGFGKTALAQQLCQDERVRETYPNGILWTTMGEDIDANGRLSRIRDLIRWWTREESPAFETPAAAGARLRELLASSQVLLVIDDVWSSADVTPFQGIGNSSALLITTRDSQTLPSGSKKIEVDAMASVEAVSLLRSELPAEEERDFASLASRLGEWPLLLKMVNRQLRELVNDERRTIPMALKEINKALDSEGFAAFDREDQESRHAAASKTILVSAQRLAEKDRERYFQLAVFPEDVQIPVAVLEKLWGLGSFQARKFCRRLHDLSLLLEFNSELETIRLHDVVRRVLIEQIGEELPNLHCHLLDAFRPVSGSWSDVPIEEEYLWRNLAGHLLGAERKDELKGLLTDFSFLQAKLNATDVNALIADYQVFAEGERDLRLIWDSLRLSAHVLARDRQQLASQIFGRLIDIQGENIRQMLNSAKAQLQLTPRPGSLAPPGGPLLRTFEGHSHWINALAVVDDRRVVSGSDNGTLRVWDLETGEALRTIKGLSRDIKSIILPVDSQYIVFISDRSRLHVWDLYSDQNLHILEGHAGEFTNLSILDNRCIVSASTDGTLRVWDLETGQALHTLKGHTAEVTDVAVVDRWCIVSASGDCTLRAWDLKTGQVLRTLKGHKSRVNAVEKLDGQRVISVSEDMTVRVWDLETGQILQNLGGSWPWTTVLVLANGRYAISSSFNSLQVWDLEAGRPLHSLTLERFTLLGWGVAAMDSRRIIFASPNGMLQVWDIETGQILRTLERHTASAPVVTIANGRYAFSASRAGALRLWDTESISPYYFEQHADQVISVSVEGPYAISASADRTLKIWDIGSGRPLRTLEGHISEITAMQIADSRRVISAACDGVIHVWDFETGQVLCSFEGHRTHVTALAVVDGRRVVSASGDGAIYVWNLETGKILRSLEEYVSIVTITGAAEAGQNPQIIDEHPEWVQAMAVLDSQHVIFAFGGGLEIWNLETGPSLWISEVDTMDITAVVVIDHRRAIFSNMYGTLGVWDIDTGQLVLKFEEHMDKVNSLAVLDSRRAVSVSSDQTIRIWNLETGLQSAVLTLDAPVLTIAVASDNRTIVAGDQWGTVHFLDLVEPE